MTYIMVPNMNAKSNQAIAEGTDQQAPLASIVSEWDETCRNCHPLSPLTCVSHCKIWKSKSQFRKLNQKSREPNYSVELLNTLKNSRRLQILEIISKRQCSIEKIQEELKNRGHYHSQGTIIQEYLAPLMETGMVEEDQNRYCATLFGYRMNELARNLHDVERLLPPHSECYEENALSILLTESKTYKDLKSAIPAKSVARVLNRLQKARLIETAKENDYVYYFRTKRDAELAKLSPTEKRVYGNIPADGISARKLREKTQISLRRTYKYIRKLKGKKLVFLRQKPKFYSLTANGLQIASILRQINDLTAEVLAATSQTVNKEETRGLTMLGTRQKEENRDEKVISLTSRQ